MYFKANLEVGKKKKSERILFISAKDIIEAMDTTKRIRWSRMLLLKPINYEEYMKGVDRKYKNQS